MSTTKHAPTVPGKAIRRALEVMERWGFKAPYRGAVAEEALDAAASAILAYETREWMEHFMHHPVDQWTRADLVRIFGNRLDELLED